MRIMMVSLDKDFLSPKSRTTVRLLPMSRKLEELVVILPNSNGQKTVLNNNFSCLPCGSKFKPWGFIKSLFSLVWLNHQQRFDVVSAQDPIFCGLLAYLTAKLTRIKWHLQIHGDFFSPWWLQESRANKFKYWLMVYLVKRAPSLRVASQRLKNSLIKIGVHSEIIQVAPVVEKETTVEMVNLEKRTNDLLFVGRFSPEKNLPLLFRSFAEVIKSHPETKLFLIGTGEESALIEKLIGELNLIDQVIIKSWSDNLTNIYSQAGILVLPSFYEGWGRAVVEAINFGLAIVMTDVGLAGEFIVNNHNGLVVEVNNQAALTAAINKLLADQNFKQRLIETAQAEVKNLPTFEQVLEINKLSWQQAVTG